jgi:apolipoprotein N-acyltransferase
MMQEQYSGGFQSTIWWIPNSYSTGCLSLANVNPCFVIGLALAYLFRASVLCHIVNLHIKTLIPFDKLQLMDELWCQYKF